MNSSGLKCETYLVKFNGNKGESEWI